MKRLSVALTAMGLSLSAIAALPATTDPNLVEVPHLPGGLVVGASGFYLQPTYSNGDTDYASVNTNFPSNFSTAIQNVDPDYDWGWGVNVGYIFPDTANDANVSYTHYDTDYNNSAAVPFTNPILFNAPTVIAVNNPDFIDFLSASSTLKYNFNQVDGTLGQYIYIGCRVILHPYAGVRWFEVDRRLNTLFTAFTNQAFSNDYISEESDFNGIGPLVGFDASYYLAYGFGIVGHFDSAIALGSLDSSTDFSNLLGNTSTTNINAEYDTSKRLVPSVDGKLGLNYTYLFNNTYNSDLTLELGWQMSNYFNAIDRVNETTIVPTHTTSDFGLQGPYVNLTFHA